MSISVLLFIMIIDSSHRARISVYARKMPCYARFQTPGIGSAKEIAICDFFTTKSNKTVFYALELCYKAQLFHLVIF